MTFHKKKISGQFLILSNGSFSCNHDGCKDTIITCFPLQEVRTLQTDSTVEGIEGGHLLATRSGSVLHFYDWDTGSLIRRIEIVAKHVYWSDSAELVFFSV